MFCLSRSIGIEESIVWKVYLRFITLLRLSMKTKMHPYKTKERFLIIYGI